MTYRSPVPPQVEILPGMPPSPKAPVELDARNALAHLLRPEIVGMRPEDYAEASPDILRYADVGRYAALLLDIGPDRPTSLGYRSESEGRMIFTAATPTEYSLLAGNLYVLGNRASARVEAARQGKRGSLKEVDADAARRAGVHGVERQLEKTQKFVVNSLQPEQELIRRFREAAQNPGFARGKQIDLRIGLAEIQEGVIGKLFAALRAQRNWTPQQARLARMVTDRRIFIERHGNQHIGYFDNILALAQVRNAYIGHVAKVRITTAEKYLAKYSQ